MMINSVSLRSRFSERVTPLVAAVGTAAALALTPSFAAAGDRGWSHGHSRGGPGASVSPIRHPETLMGGYGPRGGVRIDSGRDFRHSHRQDRDFNIWPWIAGAAILGITAPRVYQVPPPAVIYDRPYSGYNYGYYQPEYYQEPLRQNRPVMVCFERVCTPKTGEVELNGQICETTYRDGADRAICPDGSAYTARAPR